MRASLPMILLLILLLSLGAQQLLAESHWEVSFSGGGAYRLGETEYIYDQSFNTPQGVGRLKSQLEFPLDGPLIGGQFRAESVANSSAWGFDGEFYTNLANPGEVMKDHDWITVPGQFDGKFSFTESSVEMRMWMAGGTVWWHMVKTPRFAFGPLGGYRFQWLTQDVRGFAGWQIDPTNPPFTPVSFDVPDTLGIVYDITYHLSMVGASSTIMLGPGSPLDLRGALVFAYYSDLDDHVLRFKTAESTGSGLGGWFAANWRWHMGGADGGRRPFLSLAGEFLTLSADGDQVQKWYGDDPASEENDTGTVVKDLPHEVNSTQYGFMVTVGMSL